METAQTLLISQSYLATVIIVISLLYILLLAYLERDKNDSRLYMALFGAEMGFLMLLNVILQSIRSL